MNTSSDRPRVVQRTKEPVFTGGGTEDLSCMKCGHHLVLAVNMRSLIAIDIECHMCAAVTRTPSWPDGESLPHQVATIGAYGRYSISQVTLDADMAFTCDAEIERVRKATLVKPLQSGGSIPVTSQSPASWEAELSILTEDQFPKMIAAARRAHARGNKRFVKCPPAWAIVHIQSKLATKTLGTAEEDAIAMGYIAQVHDLINRWNHHHHFPLIVRALCSEFNHTGVMLAAAGHLGENGNDVGITDTASASASGQSPDLYINTGPYSRLSIEVKAPDLFFWPSPVLSIGDMEKHIHRSLRAAKGQLTGERGGVVIIGASHPNQGVKEVFQNAIKNVIHSGKVSTRIAAVIGVFHLFGQSLGNGKVNWQAESAVWTELNPRFPGTNPIDVR